MFDGKHNAANAEDNRDGSDFNLSWNCGVEVTEDQVIERLRNPGSGAVERPAPVVTGYADSLLGRKERRARKADRRPYDIDQLTSNRPRSSWSRAEEACWRLTKLFPPSPSASMRKKSNRRPIVVAPTARCSSPHHAIGEFISGVILQDETIHQRSSQGIPDGRGAVAAGDPTRHQGR